jgi:hypothetical protein
MCDLGDIEVVVVFRVLYASDNQLTGGIPSELGSMTALV